MKARQSLRSSRNESERVTGFLRSCERNKSKPRRKKGRAPGKTDAANESFPRREDRRVCERVGAVMAREIMSRSSCLRVSSIESEVVMEFIQIPRNDMSWVGDTVFPGLTARPNLANMAVAVSSMACASFGESAM